MKSSTEAALSVHSLAVRPDMSCGIVNCTYYEISVHCMLQEQQQLWRKKYGSTGESLFERRQDNEILIEEREQR